MLTIRAMTNGAGYAKKHLERNDYYAEGEKVVGIWFGHGAEKLGLNGRVQLEQFERVRQGFHPETGEKLRQRKSADRTARNGDKQSHGRNLYDFTFSAPKSVSIMAILGGDARLIEAHDRAVRDALAEMERWAATRVRIGKETGDRTTGNLIVACFRHDSSRSLCPQLHHHCVAANMTFDAVENRWKALQATGIYERRAFLSEVYRNRLAEVVRQLGYEIENRKNGFEIRGVAQTLIEQFSQRSKDRDREIAAFIEAHGRAPTDTEIAVLVRESRPEKLIEISTEEVRKAQFARLTRDGERDLAAVRTQAESNRVKVKTHSAELSLQHGLDHIFERVSVAKDFEILAEALKHGRGQIQLAELKQAFRSRETRDEIIRSGDEIATHASLERERQMIEMVNLLQGSLERLGREPQGFELSPKLTAEQRNVVQFVLESRDRVVSVQGAAGAGKTATLGELRRALEDNGRRTWAVAPTASAVDELAKVGFSFPQTVERFLLDTDVHAYLPKSAIVVDEAGMLSARQMHALLNLAARCDARLIFCGDTRQIPSVEAGDALRILEKESRLATIGLGEVKRQQNKEYKEAIKTLRSDPSRGFDKLDRMGAIKEAFLLERPQMVAEAYRAAIGQVLVVAPTHEEIVRVTQAIRYDRRERGELGPEQKLQRFEPLNWTEAQKRDMANYAPGQVLVFHKGTTGARKHEALSVVRQDGSAVFTRNASGKEVQITKKQARCFGVFVPRDIEVAVGDWISIEANLRDSQHRLTNGDRSRVASIDEHGAMQLEDGRIVPKNFRQFNHGYAVTAHRSQGKTVDEVLISCDRMTRELFYVAASRGRHRITVFTGEKEALRDAVAVSGLRMSALELLRKQARTVERSRFAERPRTFVERIGGLMEKILSNLPRFSFGQRNAPERQGMEYGR
jgi:conjugative relaxase-like TrwC/TraI family protein